MSDYKRLVAYIYLYDKGIKVKNSGFAKIECRNDKLRVNISLKGYFGEQQNNWKVYLLKESKKSFITILMGNLKCKGQGAEFKYFENVGNILNEPFENIKGLAIISKSGQKYATFWEDTNLLIDDIIISENIYEKANNVQKDKPKDRPKEVKKPDEVIAKIEDEPAEQDNVSAAEQNQELYKENKIIEATSVHEECEEEYSYEDDYDRFVKEYFKLVPENLDSQNHTIRVELKDLKVLPKSQWVLGNNSFLLHAYYNYHYIILGRVDGKYIVGVPGVFCNREKMVASMFGFSDFKASQVAELKTGRFGYWYKYI